MPTAIPEPTSSVRRQRVVAHALVAACASLPFLSVLWAWFGADDFVFVYLLRETPQLGLFIWRDFIENFGSHGFYRPLGLLLMKLDLMLGGGAAWVMHAHNLVLHVLVSLGVFRLGLALAPPGRSPWPSALAAAFFAAFPRRVEAVAWMSCRPDLIATCCAVWTAVVVARGWPRAGVVGWLASLLGKESTIGLPLALAAIPVRDARAVGEWARRVGRRLLPFGVAGLAYLLFRRSVIGGWIGGYGAAQHTPGLRDIDGVAKYLAYSLLPPLEPLGHAIRDRDVLLATGAVVLTVCAIAVWALVRARRVHAVQVGVLWFLCAIVPVISLPVSLTTTQNDRLLYLPAVGVALAMSGLPLLARRAATFVLAAAIAACAVFTVDVAERWRMAGHVTREWLVGLDTIKRTLPTGCAIWVTAAPDNFDGAYVLRSGWRFGLAMLDAREPPEVHALSLYVQEARGVVPVTVTLAEGAEVRLDSVGPHPQVVAVWPAGTPGAEWHEIASVGDRFGRSLRGRAHLTTPGLIVGPSPTGPVVLGATTAACARVTASR